MTMTPEAPGRLSLAGIGRNFGGLKALRDVSFDVAPGEVVGIIGPNGAGKSTLFNVIAGKLRATSGRISLGANDITRMDVRRRVRLGIVSTFQIPRQLNGLTVGGVLAAAFHYGAGPAADPKTVERLCDEFGFYLDETTDSLDMHRLKQLELVRALVTLPSIVLLDEVAAGLDAQQREVVIGHVRRLAHEGKTVLIVEHRMDFLRSLCDRALVLSFGSMLFDGAVADALSDDAVVEAYLGAPNGAA